MPHALRALAAVLTVLWAVPAFASETATSKQAEAPRWSFGGEADYYYLPHDADYSRWVVSATRGLLRLEARYNYEDIRTFSGFFGLKFGFGDTLRLELTPMAGVIAGRTNGLGPGAELDLSYWKLELYSEGEYVFDVVSSSDSFFYSWTELSLWPVEWARVGVIADRTKPRQSDFDVQRGFLVGLSYRQFSVTAHFLNPGAERAYTIFTLSVEL